MEGTLSSAYKYPKLRAMPISTSHTDGASTVKVSLSRVTVASGGNGKLAANMQSFSARSADRQIILVFLLSILPSPLTQVKQVTERQDDYSLNEILIFQLKIGKF